MAVDDALGRAFALADAMVAVARQKSGAGGLVSSPLGGAGVSNSPGLKMERGRHLTGWPYAVIRVIAQRIAAQPVRMGRPAAGTTPKKRANKDRAPGWLKQAVPDEVELVESHPLLAALARPNPYMVGWSLMFLSICHLEAIGETYWWLTDDGDGLQIWPLHPSWVTPEHTDEELFVRYKVLVQGSGEGTTVPADQMVRLNLPDPQDPYLGALSPLQTQAKAIVADEAIQTAQYRAFENGVMPHHGIVVGRNPDLSGTGVGGQRPVLTKEQRATLTAALKQAYRGVMNAGEPIILDGLIEDVKELSTKPAEMAFLESAKLTKERITQGFGVNPIVMGQVEGANRASATVADENFVANAVNPLVELLSQTLTVEVAPRVGEPGALIWIEPARTRDPDQERLDRDQLIKAITKNELRASMDLPPLAEGGDELVSPLPPALGQEVDGRRAVSFRRQAG